MELRSIGRQFDPNDLSQSSYYSKRYTKSKTVAPLILKDQIWVKFYDVQYVMCAKPET